VKREEKRSPGPGDDDQVEMTREGTRKDGPENHGVLVSQGTNQPSGQKSSSAVLRNHGQFTAA